MAGRVGIESIQLVFRSAAELCLADAPVQKKKETTKLPGPARRSEAQGATCEATCCPQSAPLRRELVVLPTLRGADLEKTRCVCVCVLLDGGIRCAQRGFDRFVSHALCVCVRARGPTCLLCARRAFSQGV